jgi:hypothetical protein
MLAKINRLHEKPKLNKTLITALACWSVRKASLTSDTGKFFTLKVVCNEKRGGSARWQFLVLSMEH